MMCRLPQTATVKCFFLLCLAAQLTSVPAVAQTSDSSAPVSAAAPVVELKRNPIDVLRELEPPADAPYELGVGDEITVDVAGRPELSSKHIVGPDGKITVPIAGTVDVLNKTREEAAVAIQNALSSYYVGVTVYVSVDRYSSNQITLLGAVEHPGVMTFDGTPLLLEVLSRGGASPMKTASSSSSMSANVLSPYPEECIIYRGKDTVFTVELRHLLEENNDLADYRLKRGDIVYVPGLTKYVSVLGQVYHTGTLQLTSKSTLAELIAETGGPTEKAGHSPVIEVIHHPDGKAAGKVQLIRYNDLLRQKPVDLTLYSGDIIYVPESGFNKTAYTIEKLAPLVSLVTLGAILH